MKHTLVVLGLIGFGLRAHAWGERGHHVLCEAATRLVQSPELAAFLQGRGHQAGHVCNIPDINWRSLPTQTKVGENSHFMDPENLGYQIDTVPLSLGDIAKAKGLTKEKAALELGSLWWRADQFHRRAIADGKAAAAAALPSSAQAQDNAHPYNKAVYEFLVDLYLIGHFAGDSTMPYHNTADYDGWSSGRGGIHAFYESTCVSALGLELAAEVHQVASVMRSNATPWTSALEKIRLSSVQSYGELGQLEALDVLLAPSVASTHTYAKRPPADEAARRFRPLIVRQLARAAALLSEMWDAAYDAAGKPNLKAYRSYRYPLAPDYVEVDYTTSP